MANHPNRSTNLARIRKQIMEREGVEKVRITRDGEIHAYGDMPRGDGGESPWWQFLGYITDPEFSDL